MKAGPRVASSMMSAIPASPVPEAVNQTAALVEGRRGLILDTSEAALSSPKKSEGGFFKEASRSIL